MSILSLRSNSRPHVYHIHDLTDDCLVRIFQEISHVDLTRCGLVCKKWRELIEDEEEKGELERATQRARIFVCDRRRAILEKLPSARFIRLRRMGSNRVNMSRVSSKETVSTNSTRRTRSTATSASSDTGSQCEGNSSSFITDQYTDIKDSNWAFKFDFGYWKQKYEITEVFFKNFCSFFDREHSQIEMNFGKPSTGSPVGGGYPSSSKIESPNAPRAYDTLPSSQAVVPDVSITKNIEYLRRMSSGRVEHLAVTLRDVEPLHLIFRDFCCYNHRPPALIFWFIDMMGTNVNRLTFDRLQSSVSLDAHDVISLAGIDSLTIIQPENKPNLLVRGNFLLSWLRLAAPDRKRISIHLTGCHELTARGLAAFVSAWKIMSEPAVFSSITLDGDSMRYHKFFAELELSQQDSLAPSSKKGSPLSNTMDTTFIDKILLIKHTKKSDVHLKFCYSDKRIILRCIDSAPAKSAPRSVASTLRLARPQSMAVISNAIQLKLPRVASRGMLRPLSQNALACRDNEKVEENLVTKVMRFLAT